MLNNKLIDFLCGYPDEDIGKSHWESGATEYYSIKTGEPLQEFYVKGLIQTTWEKFGGSIDESGRLIMHPMKPYTLDVVYQDTLDEIYKRLEAKGFSRKNVTL